MQEPADTYLATLVYTCTPGSQFDTDGDGAGDTVELRTTCQWRKAWEPWALLPPCRITHCVWPPTVPGPSHLEEVTDQWTPVNTSKQYRCEGMQEDGTHTSFWETDRTKSTFSIPCQPDGLFDFVSEPGSWPVCLEDVTCPPPPPIPSHSEHALVTGQRWLRDPGVDDARITFRSLLFPSGAKHNGWLNSTHSNSSLRPTNYMANLT
jgi:hypothetical protein